MAGKVTVWVHANGHQYAPGDEPSAEDAKEIRNPACWEGGDLPDEVEPSPDPDGPAPAPVPPVVPTPAPERPGPQPAPGLVPPPRSGRGSGRDHWVAFASLAGVEVTDEMPRDAIVAACEVAGVIEPEDADGE